MAEAVEVADVEARSRGRADGLLDALAELPRGLDVVGQDEDLLGEQRALRRGRLRGVGAG